MRKTSVMFAAVGLIASMLGACASAPESRPDQRALEARSDAVLQTMIARDPSLGELLARAPGYVVFPEVVEGGLIVGGAQAVGVVYEDGDPVGYAELRNASIGAQLGGMSYSELIVFATDDAFTRLRAGNFDISADLRATAIQSGAATSAHFEGGTAVFIDDESGLMAGASLAGEQISFTAK
jgi:lipid-binding SYLF domain-containing protein